MPSAGGEQLELGAVPVLTRNTVFLPCSWLVALIWWESSLVSSTAMKVFPESVFRQTIVLCSRAASRSSTCPHQTQGQEQLQGGGRDGWMDGRINLCNICSSVTKIFPCLENSPVRRRTLQ